MFGLLFAVIGSGILIMSLLFLYWIKYIYVDKDEENNKSQYTPISKEPEEKETNNQTLYQVDPNFLKKRKNKKD